jgi:hypothetical protein
MKKKISDRLVKLKKNHFHKKKRPPGGWRARKKCSSFASRVPSARQRRKQWALIWRLEEAREGEREKKPQAPRKKSKIDAADGETKVKRLTLCRWFLIINILYTNCLVCKDLSSCSEPQLRRCMRKSRNRQLRNNRKNVLRLTSKRVWTRNSRNYMQADGRW